MLTPELRARIVMMMRVANHLQKNRHIIKGNATMENGLAKLKELLGQMMELISEEERDSLLEQYREEALFLGLSR